MIQGLRIFLQPGVTGTVLPAARSPIYDVYNGFNDGGTGPGDVTCVNVNTITEQNELPVDNVPQTTAPDVTKYQNNYGQWFPWYDSTTEKWVQAYVDSNILTQENFYDYNSIGWQNYIFPIVISAQLDPMQEPQWGASLALNSGNNWVPYPNMKAARVALVCSNPRLIDMFNVVDSGKFGWAVAGHGVRGASYNSLDWGPLQFLNFLQNRVNLNPGT